MNRGATEMERGLARRVKELRADLFRRDPAALARNTGAILENGHFHLDVWEDQLTITARDFVARDEHSGKRCDELTQALLAYYFHFSNGTPLTGRWIAFGELPDGAFYTGAFQAYTGNKLAAEFGNNLGEFSRAAGKAGGVVEQSADSAYRFLALPMVPLAVFGWLGDEDFPPSYRVLFDASASNHLPTDGCAILGSMLTSRLLKTAKEKDISLES